MPTPGLNVYRRNNLDPVQSLYHEMSRSRVGTERMIKMLPTGADTAKLKLELRLLPDTDREDAVQEAWLALLSGRDPARAVNTFGQRERRHRQRSACMVNQEMN